MKKIKLVPNKCVGCKLCVLNCSFSKFRVYSHDIANIHVVTIEDVADSTPYMCVQCDERSCINACPVSALSLNETNGAIAVDRDVCILCGICAKACVHNGIRVIKYEGEEILAVCDLCDGQEPRCADACRENAILFE